MGLSDSFNKWVDYLLDRQYGAQAYHLERLAQIIDTQVIVRFEEENKKYRAHLAGCFIEWGYCFLSQPAARGIKIAGVETYAYGRTQISATAALAKDIFEQAQSDSGVIILVPDTEQPIKNLYHAYSLCATSGYSPRLKAIYRKEKHLLYPYNVADYHKTVSAAPPPQQKLLPGPQSSTPLPPTGSFDMDTLLDKLCNGPE